MKRMIIAVLATLLAACGTSTPTGDLQILLVAEDTITGGLAAGTGDEDVIDGWSVAFDRYVVVVADVEVEGGGEGHFHHHDALAIDLVQIPEGGHELVTLEGMTAALWPEVRFSTPAATSETVRHESVPQADFDRMVAGGCTYLIAGTISNPTGERCIRGDDTMCTAGVTEVRFDLCVPAATDFGPCASDTGIEGVTVAASTSTAVNLTIHGDHLFFNGFPVGAEGSVVRRAQWMANSDVDADGTVEQSDLEAIGASDLGQLLPIDPGDGSPGFALAGAPSVDGHGLDTAWDYVRAQLKTQGHFQGEGECPIDGAAHDHRL